MVNITTSIMSIDDNSLYIAASIPSNPAYNAKITDIYIDTEETFVTTRPSENAYEYKKYNPDKEAATEWDVTITAKELGMVEKLAVDNVANHIFFVYVIAEGTVDADAPCKADENIAMAVIYNRQLVYSTIMANINDAFNENSCTRPVGLMYSLLKYDAFNIALSSNEFLKAIELWKNFYSKDTAIIETTKCKCNG